MSPHQANPRAAVRSALADSVESTGFSIKGCIDCSLLDWPGKVATVLFLPGCNFRCPFCHNHPIVLSPGELPDHSLDEILSRCRRQADWIDGVVVSGGEPTIHSWLPELLRRIRHEGFSVKLDTNGSHPHVLVDLFSQGLVDFVAMDLKAPLETGVYGILAGAPVDMEVIRRSIDIIASSGVDHAFRATVMPHLFTEDLVREMAAVLPRQSPFTLQNFRPENALDPSWRTRKSFTEVELLGLLHALEEYRSLLPSTLPGCAPVIEPAARLLDSCLAAVGSATP